LLKPILRPHYRQKPRKMNPWVEWFSSTEDEA
jgi:hypothetical protein